MEFANCIFTSQIDIVLWVRQGYLIINLVYLSQFLELCKLGRC